MTTLRELVRQRQRETASPLTDHLSKAPGPSLRVVASNGDLWGFPWTHFVYVRVVGCDERDVMSVVFVSHEVAVFGQHLTQLTEEIANQRLPELRPNKSEYATKDSSLCWIDQVEVFVRDEPPNKDNTSDLKSVV